MTPDKEPPLLQAATELSDRVGTLARHLRVSQRQVRRMRVLTIVTAVLAVLAVIGGVVSIRLVQQVRDTAHDNEVAAVQGCRNANESREANLKLWGFVLDASKANRPDMSARQKVQIEQMRTWIAKLYAPHDCSELGKKYPLPNPPPILKDQG